MSRPTLILTAGAVALTAVVGTAGVAVASESGHHHSHGHQHHGRGHGRVGDDIYSSRDSDRYGPDYGIVGGLVWNLTHLL
jgi:hypothetical protein